MLSYDFYKTLHLFSLVLFLGTMSFTLAQPAGQAPKQMKILSGVSSLFLLVAGMGLLARIGVSHGTGWPLWAMLRVAL